MSGTGLQLISSGLTFSGESSTEKCFTDESGEFVCEQRGLRKKECDSLTCCQWDEKRCWSSVGQMSCYRNNPGGLAKATITRIIVGVIGGLVALGVFICCMYVQRRKKDTQGALESQSSLQTHPSVPQQAPTNNRRWFTTSAAPMLQCQASQRPVLTHRPLAPANSSNNVPLGPPARANSSYNVPLHRPPAPADSSNNVPLGNAAPAPPDNHLRHSMNQNNSARSGVKREDSGVSISGMMKMWARVSCCDT